MGADARNIKPQRRFWFDVILPSWKSQKRRPRLFSDVQQSILFANGQL